MPTVGLRDVLWPELKILKVFWPWDTRFGFNMQFSINTDKKNLLKWVIHAYNRVLEVFCGHSSKF